MGTRPAPQELLVRDPQRRLGAKAGAEEIKAHPFFKSIEWALLRWHRPPFVPGNDASPAAVAAAVAAAAAAVPDGGVFPME